MNERMLYELSKKADEDAFSYADFDVEELVGVETGTQTEEFVKKYKAYHTDIKTSRMVHDEDW